MNAPHIANSICYLSVCKDTVTDKNVVFKILVTVAVLYRTQGRKGPECDAERARAQPNLYTLCSRY
jgi:hypothetical protein